MAYLRAMQIVIDIVEAADRLEELIGWACAGVEVSISIDGIPRVTLVPLVTLEEHQATGRLS